VTKSGLAIRTLIKIPSVKRAGNSRPEALKKLQEKRFRRIFKHVLVHSPFYKKLYGQNGINLANADKIRLENLPVTDKKMMMENFDAFVCDKNLKLKEIERFLSDKSNLGKKFKNKHTVFYTSGTTGLKGVFACGPNDWATVMAMNMTRVIKARLNPFRKTKMVFIGATDGLYAAVTIAEDAPRILFDVKTIYINDPTEKLRKEMENFKPELLTGYSSSIYLLALEQLAGRLNIGPKKIVCSGDTLTEQMRETIRKAFSIYPVNFYAASESMCMAVREEESQTFDLFTDWHCFELLDRNLRPVASGQPGNLILTNLYNYAQPLIRYRMNDQLAPDYQVRANPFPKIKTIAGRQENFLWFQKGETAEFIHPMAIDFSAPGLLKYQAIQEAKNSLLIKIVLKDEDPESIKSVSGRMKEILAEKGLDNIVNFRIQPVPDIPVDPKTGKFRHIIPL